MNCAPVSCLRRKDNLTALEEAVLQRCWRKPILFLGQSRSAPVSYAAVIDNPPGRSPLFTQSGQFPSSSRLLPLVDGERKSHGAADYHRPCPGPAVVHAGPCCRAAWRSFLSVERA